MNYNDILNNIIAGIMVAFISTISTIVFNFLKSSYKKSNKILVVYDINIYYNLFLLVFNSIMIDKNSFFSMPYNYLFFFNIILNIFNIVFSHHQTNIYVKDSSFNGKNR